MEKTGIGGQITQITALLAGSAALMFAGGMNALILPLRGTAEGFSDLSLGLLGTGWAVGYVSGCLLVPRLVSTVGHIRSFSAMCGLAAISILMSLLLIHAPAWIILRSLAGFCFAGAAMVVESWLNERTEPGSRGRIFGIYTMVNLAATTAGQMLLALGDPRGFALFALAAIFYVLALIPTAITTQAQPQPMQATRLDVPRLWKNSPLAVVAVLMVGVSNSAFGTLGAVFGAQIGLATGTIALFLSIAVVAGAVLQIPVGFLSDRMDRRYVLLGLAAAAAAADLTFVLLAPQNALVVLVLASAFGAAIFAMYPVIVAHANDHAPPGDHLRTSGGLLLVFGIGSVFGPLAAGVVMESMGPRGLFATTLVAHLLVIGYGALRIRRRSAPAAEGKASFQPAPSAAVTTPQTLVLAPDANPPGNGSERARAAETSPDAAPSSGPETTPQER